MLAVSLALTLHSWRQEQRNAEQVLQSDFDFHVHEAISVIEQRLAAYQQVLHGAAGLFASSRHVDRQEFRAYVAALRLPQNLPGILELSLVEPTPPAGDGGRTSIRLSAASGIDAYASAVQDEALVHARDQGAIAVSRKLALASAGAGAAQHGFLMVLPVYRNGAPTNSVEQRRAGLAGWIVAQVRIADLVAPPAHLDAHELDVEVYDGEQLSDPALLFDTDNRPMHASAAPSRYQASHRLQVANSVWTVAVRSLPRFEARLDRSAAVKGWFGVGTSVLLALVTWLLASSRARAVATAGEMHRELIGREARYRQMFEHSASIAFMIDPGSGRIVDANLAAAAFWGYPLRRLRRMSIFDIADAPHDCMRDLLSDADCGAAVRVECRHRLAGGALRDVELYAGTMAHQGKALVYAILHDITTRKQAEQALRASEERLRLIAESTDDVIWMMDAHTLRFTYVSPAIERQRGYTPQEIMDLHRDVLVAPPAQPVAQSMPQMGRRMQERIRRFIEGDESQRHDVKEIDQPHKDGRTIPVEVKSTLLCDEHRMPCAIVGVSRDISARRQAQEEQKRFVAMVSHEFRTPLATIDGAVQRLQATAGQVDAATHNRFTKIQKAVDRLTALLDDYLTQDRIDTAGHGLHLSLAAPHALLRDAEASAKALSAGHVIEIDAQHAPERFLCDADRLRLALRVLADNAVKYTPPGSRILLRACRASGGIEFIVADNGRGIPPTELPQVFDKFFRGRSASQQSGSGLGLHMARSVVEMHGGTINASNRVEGGAQITVWLPDRQREEKPP